MFGRRLRYFLPLLLTGALFVNACGSSDREAVTQDSGGTVPSSIQNTAPSSPPTTRAQGQHLVAHGTGVDGDLTIYESPDGPVQTTIKNPWIGESPAYLLVKESLGDWLEVYLPIRPNGVTGFVRATDFPLYDHNWKIEVNLSEFKLRLFDGDNLVKQIDIAVAANNTPTPGGLYYTTELLAPTDDFGNPDPNGVYGPFAYGLSGYSEVHQSFNGGPGQLGIHGTNQPDLIGQAVSNGCIRMSNDDITSLTELNLPLGIPVEIIA